MNIINDIVSDIKSDFPTVLSIYLVGSYALKVENEHSDIDFYLFFKHIQDRDKKLISQLHSKYLDKHKKSVELNLHLEEHVLNQPAMSNRGYCVRGMLQKNAKFLFGKKYYVDPFNLKQTEDKVLYDTLSRLNFILKKKAEISFDYSFLKNTLRFYIGRSILQNVELLPHAIEYIDLGITNSRYQDWKDHVPLEINQIHKKFILNDKYLVNRKSLYIHSDDINKFIGFINENLMKHSLEISNILKMRLTQDNQHELFYQKMKRLIQTRC